MACISILAFLLLLSAGRLLMAGELDELKLQIIELQNQGALGVRDLALSPQIHGYGSYEPFQDNVMRHDRPAYVYFEPINLFTNVSTDGYSFSLSQDMVILDSAGREIFRKDGAVKFNSRSNKPIFDIYLQNTLTINQPGDYVFKVIVHDELRQESVEAELPIRVQ